MTFKKCTKCGKNKLESLFNKCKANSDGLFSWCRECARVNLSAKYKSDPEYWRSRNQKWAVANRDKSNQIKKSWDKAHPEVKKAWVVNNPEKDRLSKSKYSKNNRDKANHSLAAYRAKKFKATPPWEEPEITELIYAEAIHRGLHVDHIVPLQGENVCGLHVYNNLQLLSRKNNAAKGNKWPCESRILF